MNRPGPSSQFILRQLLPAALAVALAAPAHAVLVNKYTFNNNTANDSVSGQNGVVVDNTGIATYTGGAINLSGNNGAGSNQDFTQPATVGAFVDLPNGVFTSAVTSTAGGGVFGQASLEIWFTVDQNRNWAEVYSFGTSNAGENTSTGGNTSDYVSLIPQSGPGDFRATTHSAANVETPIIGQATPLTVNQKYHVVLTLDELDPTAGPNGTAKLYLNNSAPTMATIQPILDAINDNNNWLGRSPWPDALFDGLIDEFRIYNHAMTAAQVAASFTAGPDPAPLPVLVVNRSTGAISIANQSAGSVQLKGYSIASAAGGLNPATWTSIDADNTFDTNGTWTAQSSTSLQIAESVTGGTLDGGPLAPSSSRGIGLPWVKSPFEDLTFSFTLGDGTTGTGQVQYTGAAAMRSDLNGDGAINAADWALFKPNAFTTFATDALVVAYRKGDLDGDKDNDYADFKIFKADYVAVNGVAAFAALGAAIPEPTGLSLALLAALVVVPRRRGTV
jgi:hypothetical protein